MDVLLCLLYVLLSVFNISFAQNDNCRVGTYGNNCQLNCPKECRPLQIFPCNKKTGRCAEGCNNGYYGDQCDKRCSCPSGICYQANGDCYGTDTTTDRTIHNTTNRVGSTIATPVQTNDDEGVATGWKTLPIVLIAIIICLVLGGFVVFLYLRFKEQEITLPGSWKIRLSKVADADVSGDEETGIEQGKTPLMQQEAGKEASGGQNEFSEQHGDQTWEISQGFKQPTQVEERNQQITQLKEENEKMKGALSRYEYRENVIQTQLGLSPNSDSTKSSMSTNLLMSNNVFNKGNWLHCPDVMFDKETVNVKVAQIDVNMVLWNIPGPRNQENNSRRFQQFQGARCTGPLVNTGLYQYFEAKFDIRLNQPVEGLIAQLGLCGDKDKEPLTPFIDTEKPCFVMEVVSCKKHNKICLMSIDKGKKVHMHELMNNVTGSNGKVHIGIRFRKDMKRIRIFDCRKTKSVQKMDIHLDEKIWPMFGVCAQDEASVNVQLIAGRNIEMWNEKKEMIQSKYM